MAFIQQISQIIGDLKRAGENVDREAEQFPKKVQDAWVYEIHVKDAIASGDYLRSIGWKANESSEDLQMFVVDSSSNREVENYSGFIEGGTKTLTARYPAQSGIERVDFVATIDALLDAGMQGAN